ncbi:LPD29 domain-containing protein, partial [Serratia marcescens]
RKPNQVAIWRDKMKTDNNKVIVIGQVVSTNLYGLGKGVVYAISGEQSSFGQGKELGGVIYRTASNAKFDIAFFNGEVSNNLPESILRGVQWTVHDEVATLEAVKMACEYSKLVADKKVEDERKAKEHFALEKERIKNLPEYQSLQSENLGGKGVAINIRRELKAAYPKTKFSVRTRDYDCVNISWTDGPTENQVKQITNKYKNGSFDAMQDMYEYSSSPFNDVFGGAKYLFTERTMSDLLIAKALEVALEKYGSEFITDECTVTSYREGRLNSFRGDFFERGLSYEINLIAKEITL